MSQILNKRRITGRVSTTENSALKRYAQLLGLNKSQLVNLLVLRSLYGQDASPLRYKSTKREADVTIMLKLKQDDDNLRTWAETLGTKAGPLVACLVRRELKEKWLASSILPQERLSQIDSGSMLR